MEKKYIMIDCCIPILFPAALTHAQVAEGVNATSAGFYEIDSGGNICVYGKSISPKLCPDDMDIWIIDKFLKRSD